MRRLLSVAAVVAAGLCAPVLAQVEASQPTTGPGPRAVPPELEPFEGRLVRAISIRQPERTLANGTVVAGAPLDSTTDALARNQLRLREGSSFSASLVTDDISRLNRLGRFKRVESRVQQLVDGSVELIYILDPQPLVTAVQTVGNRAFADNELIGDGEAMVGTPIDQTTLDRVARLIEQRYQAKGYYNTLVTIDEKELNESGVVLFRIREGERTKVMVVQFQGALSFSQDELQSAIKTRPSWLFKATPVDKDLLAQDVSALIQWYRDHGYLDVGVDVDIFPSPNGREAIVTFIVEERAAYTLRDLRLVFQGADDVPVFTSEQLLALMDVQSGDVYSDAKLKKAVETVKNAYGKLGYADVAVEKREQRDTVKPQVDVVLIITQGQRWKTGLVEVQGNYITRDDVVRRTLTIQPDRPLDTTEVKRSETRLHQTNLFNRAGTKLTIQPEDPETPGYRDVLVQVEETNTGKFSFGGSVGSDGGLVGLISLQQNNFDVTDFPDTFGELVRGDAFRGGGQTFTVAAMPGTVSNELSASLYDPYVFGTDYSGSVGGYYNTRDYNAYDEQRVGARLSIGQRFGSRWNMSIPMRFEQVQLTSINADAPVDYFEVEDPRFQGTIGLQFTRQSLDDPYFPKKGNKISFGVDQYFGESSFNRLSAGYDTYIPLSEDVLGRATVLRLQSSIKYIPQDQDDVPFYERFFLGGQSFRGFKHRGVGPVGIRNDNGQLGDDPIGGVFSFFAGAEVTQPVFEDVVAVVGFVDTGTVDDKFAFSDYRVSVGAGLRIRAPFAPTTPLAFDFGFPILKEETDRKGVFTFSIDLPFR